MLSFIFQVNKSFLEYTNHPITIPRENYPRLIEEVYGGAGDRTISVHITPIQGRNLDGEIYYGVSGGGPYYQIKILGDYPGYYLGNLYLGDFVSVTVKKENDRIDVKLCHPAECEIQTYLMGVKKGVKAAKVDPVQAYLDMFKSATPEKQMEMLAELMKKVAGN